MSLRLRSEVVVYYFSKAVPALLGLVGVIVLVRILGAAEYGIMSIAVALARFVSSGVGGWIPQSTLRFASHNAVEWSTLKRVLVRAVAYSISVATLLSFLIYLGVPVLSQQFSGAGISVIVMFSISSIFYMSILGLMQARGEARTYAAMEGTRAVLATGLAVLFAYVFDPDYKSVILGFVAATLVAPLVGYRKIRTYGHAASLENGTGSYAAGQGQVTLRGFLVFGSPVAIWIAVTLAFDVVDRTILSVLSGAEQSGIYSALNDLIFRGYGLMAIPITLAIHPRIMRGFGSGGWPAAFYYLRIGVTFQVVLAVLATIASVWAHGITAIISGQQQEIVDELLTKLILGSALWQLALLAHKPLEIFIKTEFMLLAIVLSLALSSAYNIHYVPTLGAEAVAEGAIVRGVSYILIVIALSLIIARRQPSKSP